MSSPEKIMPSDLKSKYGTADPLPQNPAWAIAGSLSPIPLPVGFHLATEQMLGHLGLDDAISLSDLGKLVPLPLRLVGHLESPVAHALILDARPRLWRRQGRRSAS